MIRAPRIEIDGIQEAALTRKQKRKIAILVILLLMLALLAAYYTYYRATQRLDFAVTGVTGEIITPPVYLYTFSGGDVERLQRPIGVMVDGEEVFVVDSARHTIEVFNEDGDRIRSFGTSETVVPLYIAKNPVDDKLYVSDRRARTIHIFEPSGAYIGEFDPKLPEDQLPTFDTGGVQWAPVALAFGDDGTMYVTEILKGHRLLIFGPGGTFQRSIGTVGIVDQADQAPEVFQFPNGLAVHEGLVYVADSNNRRIQIFDAEGEFQEIVVTQGLPRGLSFLAPFGGDEDDAPDRYVVVDTLAHDCTIWSTSGTKIVNFGQQGILEGQFSYPNGVSVMTSKNKVFVADTANGRIQVWGWPEELSPIPIPTPDQWKWCLSPLLLLPLLLLLRKKRFFSTQDFVEVMIAVERVDAMPARRRKWLVEQPAYDALKDFAQADIEMSELLNVTEHSESDAKALMEKMDISHEVAVTMAIAQRAHVFCTEDRELRRLAKLLEIDVVDHEEFLERFAGKDTQSTQSGE